MDERIPDLWAINEDASRLYQLYLAHLQMYGQHARVVAVCRQIQEYAAQGPRPEESWLTFTFLFDSLCELHDYEQAWQELRLCETWRYGGPVDLTQRQWTAHDAHALEYNYAPLLYFLGRHDEGCALLETALESWFDGGKVRSYNLLSRICNGEEEPSNRCRVTLSHFYRRLGKSLSEWAHWDEFVHGFPPRLFRLAEMKREELLAAPEQLPEFFHRLMDIQEERTTSGVGGSLSDLIDSPAKVRKRQEARQRKLDEFHERSKPRQDTLTAKLWELFPELQKHSLLGQPS